MERPLIGITMGDAAGIGPEITCKSLMQADIYDNCRPFILGDAGVIEEIIGICKLDQKVNIIKNPSEGRYTPGVVDVLDYGGIDLSRRKFGETSAMCGEAAVRYTKEACQMALDKKIDAMVSAPLNKASMRMAGYNYEGQTQIIGELCGSDNYGMVLMGKYNILMYTNHMSLMEACKKVTYEGVLKKIHLAGQGLSTLGAPGGKIAVSALNPHCGEGGLFGREEIDAIAPAIKQAQKEGINVYGPIPADIVFMPEITKDYDIIMAMYHDQANMAMKIVGFGSIVTLLVGVPVIRTSTGHGTAFDKAGLNIADYRNLHLAIKAAADLAIKRAKI
ncbi:MAG: PdxA family dehydrogenase [Acetivibrionales bacterium]|jgi:4-hydroxythreonine-4-phosphate dehydrogenase